MESPENGGGFNMAFVYDRRYGVHPSDKEWEDIKRDQEKVFGEIIKKYGEKKMHYKNGREAKNGDKVVLLPSYGPPVIGILYDATAGNDYCNGRIAPISPSNPCPNLKEVLHLDDVLKALPVEVPNSLGNPST
jgi:hypothetical protein